MLADRGLQLQSQRGALGLLRDDVIPRMLILSAHVRKARIELEAARAVCDLKRQEKKENESISFHENNFN